MFELRPYVLDSDGLAAALRLYIEEHAKLPGSPSFSVEIALETEPPEEARAVLYRIAQEALTNVRKHARAKNVMVSLSGRGDGVHCRIEDNGAGFDALEGGESPEGHLGLTSMRERAHLAGGWFQVSSRRGRGTVVEVWLPFAGPKASGGKDG